MKSRRKNAISATLGVLTSAAILAGCPSLIHVNHPVAPPPADGGSPHTGFQTHYFQLNWSGGDLGQLTQLNLKHSRGIDVMTDPNVTQLSVVLQLDIQMDHHAQLAEKYEDEVRERSSLRGSNPKVVLPFRECAERRDRNGIVVQVTQGICVRDVAIVVPKSKLLALDLTWNGASRIEDVELTKLILNAPATGWASVRRLKGDVSVQGGGAGATVQLTDIGRSSNPATGARGDVVARLSAVARMELKNVAGKVMLFVDQPQSSVVTLDGAAITQFPFQRP